MITRRALLRGVAGTAGLLGWPPGQACGEPPPETTRLRLYHSTSICVAPQYIVGELLKAERFTDIKYVKMTTAGISKALASGEIDVSLHFVAPLVIRLDAGDPVTVLGGVHPGCFELFGTDRVRVIRDLKGKTVATPELGGPAHLFLICALEPDRAARALVDGGFASRYDYALQTMKEVPCNKWRVYDPEDSVRFYALRLHEAGMIKSTPQRLIAQGTDWRILNELKKELKG